MKIAVATPEDMGFQGESSPQFPDWVLFRTDFLRPCEIRQRLRDLLAEEEADESYQTEHKLVTMNRTVLDLVTHPDIKCPGPVGYEDVFIWKDGALVPLLELHSEEWLVHFHLGDVFDREAF